MDRLPLGPCFGNRSTPRHRCIPVNLYLVSSNFAESQTHRPTGFPPTPSSVPVEAQIACMIIEQELMDFNKQVEKRLRFGENLAEGRFAVVFLCLSVDLPRIMFEYSGIRTHVVSAPVRG